MIPSVSSTRSFHADGLYAVYHKDTGDVSALQIQSNDFRQPFIVQNPEIDTIVKSALIDSAVVYRRTPAPNYQRLFDSIRYARASRYFGNPHN